MSSSQQRGFDVSHREAVNGEEPVTESWRKSERRNGTHTLRLKPIFSANYSHLLFFSTDSTVFPLLQVGYFSLV